MSVPGTRHLHLRRADEEMTKAAVAASSAARHAHLALAREHIKAAERIGHFPGKQVYI